jgi:hypothetical protein
VGSPEFCVGELSCRRGCGRFECAGWDPWWDLEMQFDQLTFLMAYNSMINVANNYQRSPSGATYRSSKTLYNE